MVTVNLTSGREEDLPCDLLVMQTGRLVAPMPGLDSWKSSGRALHQIGDSVTPRRISHAMLEAQRAARSI